MLNKRLACIHCGHNWAPHYPKVGAFGYAPARCPACGRPDWQTPAPNQTHCAACGQELRPAPRNLGELEVRIGAAILELAARPDEYIPGAPCWDVSIAEVVESLGVEPSRRLYNEIARSLRLEGWSKYQRKEPDGRRRWRFRKMFPAREAKRVHATFPKLRPAPPAGSEMFGTGARDAGVERLVEEIAAARDLKAREHLRSRLNRMLEYATPAERAQVLAKLAELGTGA